MNYTEEQKDFIFELLFKTKNITLRNGNFIYGADDDFWIFFKTKHIFLNYEKFWLIFLKKYKINHVQTKQIFCSIFSDFFNLNVDVSTMGAIPIECIVTNHYAMEFIKVL